MTDIITSSIASCVLKRTLAAADGHEASARASSSWSCLTRFAANTLTQNVSRRDRHLSLEVSLGKRTGSADTTRFDPRSMERLAAQAREAALNSREDPEHMPVLGPQTFTDPPAFSRDETWYDPAERAQAVMKIIQKLKRKGYTVSGILSVGKASRGLATTRGLNAFYRHSWGSFSITVQSGAGVGSGWAEQVVTSPADLDLEKAVEEATRTCVDCAKPREIQPGTYPIILSPDALASLVWYAAWSMNARASDEKRSCFSGKMGRQIASEKVTLRSDPLNPMAPGSTYGYEGLPAREVCWIDRGKLAALVYDRFWAKKKRQKGFTYPSNLILDGEGHALEDLIAGSDKAIYVSRLWYIRMVEPMSLTVTGITRDGTFWIEKGKKAYAVRNMRFNDSPLRLLSETEALGKPIRVAGHAPSLFPPIKAKSFRFTSVATL